MLKNIDWVTTLFLVITPLAAAALVPLQIYLYGWHGWYLFIMFGFWILTGMSITGGYHRLLAHRSYEASKLVEFLYILFGAAAFEGSAMKWCSDHRRHHRFVDTDRDPYNIKKGFWHAHIGWLFMKTSEADKADQPTDLGKDKIVMWQHRNYVWIAILMGFGLPTLVGYFLGSALGGFVFGALLRIVVTHHCTFFINSLCHMWGRQPYSDAHTARDSFILALVTYGEGYHNYHHQFQADYRNGVRWYQWDPTKWSIQLFALAGHAKKLKTVHPSQILQARLTQEEKILHRRGACSNQVSTLKSKVETAQARFKKLHSDYRDLKDTLRKKSDQRIVELRAELKVAKLEFKAAYSQWKSFARTARSQRRALSA